MKEEMTFEEFEKTYMKGVKKWDFEKFAIVCKKCGSPKVEYNNTIEIGTGWYNDIERNGDLVIKCHDCGNAFTIDAYDMTD